MYIIGCKAGADSIGAIQSVKKHTNLSLFESKRLIEQALEGNPVKLPDDFVLREDLEDFGFKLD